MQLDRNACAPALPKTKNVAGPLQLAPVRTAERPQNSRGADPKLAILPGEFLSPIMVLHRSRTREGVRTFRCRCAGEADNFSGTFQSLRQDAPEGA